MSLPFLRPYLKQAVRPIRPEHARAYLAIQRRFVQTVNAEDYIGPHDVEKQKRLEQLKTVKPLGNYHPRLRHFTSAPPLSLRDFNAKYDGIQETKPDVVTVFGMFCSPDTGHVDAKRIRQGALGTDSQLQATVP